MKPPLTHGGKRKNAGRPPDWLKEKCQNAVDKNKLIDFLTRVATGEETEQHVTKDGEVVDIAMGGMVRLRAAEMLLDRGFGKPMQAVELGAQGGGPLQIQIVNYGAKAI